MADYFPVLSRAVAGLENSTGETRRAVYERARAAIVRQLRSIEPPLSEEDISRERMQLEEAIRRVEAGAAPAPAPSAEKPQPPANRPPTSTPAPSSKPEQSASPQPTSRPQPTAKPQPTSRPLPSETTRPPADPSAERETPRGPLRPQGSSRPQQQPQDGDERAAPPGRSGSAAARPGGPPQQSRPAKRADGRPIINTADQDVGKAKTGRSGAMVGLAALGVIALAVGIGLFVMRDRLTGAAPAGGEPQQQTAERTDAPPPAPEAGADKSSDRLAQEGQAPDSQPAAAPPQTDPPAGGAGQETPAPAEQQVARGPDPAAPQPPATPQPPAQTPPSGSSTAPVAQRAVLYEEGPNQQSGEALNGTIVWRNESVNGGQSQPLETAIRGDIDIPGRGVKATLTIRRNADATLPASHTIEIQFTLPENFPNAGVSNVPGVLMKADESARGAAVAGLSVRVTNGFFLIGLSNLETERSVNEQLLRDRGWIDIPILYDNGRRAVLTLEKGTPGSQAFQDAFSAWRSASAGAPASGEAR